MSPEMLTARSAPRASRPPPSASGPGPSAAGCGAAPTSAVDRGDPGGDRRRDHPDRHRAGLWPRAAAEEIVGKAILAARDKVVLATKCGLVWHTRKGGTTSSTGRVAGAPLSRPDGDRLRGRAEPQAPRHRPYRPLHHPLAGPDDADRRDGGGAGGLKQAGARSAPSAPATSRPRMWTPMWPRGARRHPGAVFDARSATSRRTLLPVCRRTASRCWAIRRWRSACCPGGSGRTGRSTGDDQRKDDPRFRVENRARVAALATIRAHRGARRERRADRHRLDAGPARHHLRALRRAQPRAGARERAGGALRLGRDQIAAISAPSRRISTPRLGRGAS
jgi:methylglyoxal reductase